MATGDDDGGADVKTVPLQGREPGELSRVYRVPKQKSGVREGGSLLVPSARHWVLCTRTVSHICNGVEIGKPFRVFNVLPSLVIII